MLFNELIVDNFAGLGGASTGIEIATGRPVDIAINHNPTALSLHKANHPSTQHYIEDVWEVDPAKVVNGMPVSLAWFSPDCTHFSKAKGKMPRDKKIRGLAWVACRWAAKVKPRVIMLENVEEFRHWGPVDNDGQPIPEAKGKTFNKFCQTLKNLGYKVEFQELRACDYGAPTIRKRLFMIARCDGGDIVWPKPTHGNGKGKLPYRTAGEIIDWTIPCPSIFTRKKPLAEKTLIRIAKGIDRYVMNGNPYIAPVEATVSQGNQGLCTSFLSKYYTGVVGAPLTDSLPTITTVDHNALVTTAMIKRDFGQSVGSDIREPIGTIVAGGLGKSSLVTSSMIKLRNGNIGFGTNDPVHTITAGGLHIGEVRTLLELYSGNKDDTGIVKIENNWYQIVDIGMRMLQPHELAKAQGFTPDYILNSGADGERVTKTAQVAGIGNSVSPVIPTALVRHNLPELCSSQSLAAA